MKDNPSFEEEIVLSFPVTVPVITRTFEEQAPGPKGVQSLLFHESHIFFCYSTSFI